MKKLAYLFIFIFIASACKKGENDPFLSLKSRDARLKGTWVLKESTYEEIDNNELTNYKYTETFNGSVMTVSETGFSNYSISYSSEILINKDGSFKKTVVADGDSYVNDGSWWWLTDNKKKTRVAFDDDVDSFEIDRLTNKEMVLKYNSTEKDTYSGGSYDEMAVTITRTYEKK